MQFYTWITICIGYLDKYEISDIGATSKEWEHRQRTRIHKQDNQIFFKLPRNSVLRYQQVSPCERFISPSLISDFTVKIHLCNVAD